MWHFASRVAGLENPEYLKEMAKELGSLRFRTRKAPSLGTRISMCSAWTRDRLEWNHL